MNGLVKRSDVIETANKFSFTDENDRRRHLDFLDYCLKETQTAYDVDAVMKELKKFGKCHRCLNNHNSIGRCAEFCDVAKRIEIVRKGGV